MRRRDRIGAHGAAGLLLVVASGTVAVAGIASLESAAVTASHQRSLAAADAAAHAAEVVLMGHRGSDALSAALQADGTSCSFPALGEARASPDPAATADPAGDDACQAAFEAAAGEARRNGGRLAHFLVSPDLRDRAPGAGPGRLQVIVEVVLPRGLPVTAGLCQAVAAGALCWVSAWSAAEMA